MRAAAVLTPMAPAGGWTRAALRMAAGGVIFLALLVFLALTAGHMMTLGGQIGFHGGPGGDFFAYDLSTGISLKLLDSAAFADLSWFGSFAAGARIAFTREHTSGSQIYVMEINGGPARPVLNTARGFNLAPAWSPDGRWLAFQSDADGDAEIYVLDMAAPGQTPRQLTDNTVFDGDPAWSPDGEAIVFRSTRDGSGDLYIMDADGRHVRRLTHDPAWDERPAWSPDGRRIAFASYVDGGWDVFVIDVDGRSRRQLTTHPARDYYPTWSPDGRWIAFESDRQGWPQIYLLYVDAPAGDLAAHHLAADFAYQALPVWWP